LVLSEETATKGRKGTVQGQKKKSREVRFLKVRKRNRKQEKNNPESPLKKRKKYAPSPKNAKTNQG